MQRPAAGDAMGQMLAAASKNREVPVWPENWPVIQLFLCVSTQWRMGPSGATGLDYGVLFSVMARMKLTEVEHDLMFEDIRFMEQEALSAMRPTS